MSKVLVNPSAFDVAIADTGVTVPTGGSFTIPPQDYPTFAASSDTIRYLSDGTLVLNDGTDDVTILSQAVDILKGWCPQAPTTAESSDGNTKQFASTVDTDPVLLPDLAGDNIATALVRCPAQSPQSRRLMYSFDGGLTYGVLSPGEFVGWSLKGATKQIYLKGNAVGVLYESVLNMEAE